VGEGRCPCGDRGRRCAGLRATPRLDPYHGRRDRATWETDPSGPSVRYQFEHDRECRPSERRGAGPPRPSVRSPSDLACRAPTWRRRARLPAAQPQIVDVPLGKRIDRATGRLEFHTVRIVDGQAFSAFKESSAITSMAHADGYIEIPADVERLEAGETVRVTL